MGEYSPAHIDLNCTSHKEIRVLLSNRERFLLENSSFKERSEELFNRNICTQKHSV